MRMVWVVDAGLPGPLQRADLRPSGVTSARPICWIPWPGSSGEYDGALHLAGEQRARDVRRMEAFRAVGLETFTMLSSDLRSVGRWPTA